MAAAAAAATFTFDSLSSSGLDPAVIRAALRGEGVLPPSMIKMLENQGAPAEMVEALKARSGKSNEVENNNNNHNVMKQIESDSSVRLVPKSDTNFVVTVDRANQATGTKILLATIAEESTNTHQEFKFRKINEAIGEVAFLCGHAPSRAIECPSNGEGNKQLQIGEHSRDNTCQKWKIVHVSDSWYRLVLVKSGNALTVEGHGDGAKIVTAPWKGTPNQLFQISVTC